MWHGLLYAGLAGSRRRVTVVIAVLGTGELQLAWYAIPDSQDIPPHAFLVAGSLMTREADCPL